MNEVKLRTVSWFMSAIKASALFIFPTRSEVVWKSMV